MKAVLFKWQSLIKEQRLPFEQIALEDKLRYERDLKSGQSTRNSSINVKL
jgi:hypothetical protein